MRGEGRSASGRSLQTLKGAGVLVAWFGAVFCGWKAAQSADLLEAVARGTVAWLGFVGVWLGGIAACERLLPPSETRQTVINTERDEPPDSGA